MPFHFVAGKADIPTAHHLKGNHHLLASIRKTARNDVTLSSSQLHLLILALPERRW